MKAESEIRMIGNRALINALGQIEAERIHGVSIMGSIQLHRVAVSWIAEDVA